MIKSLVSIVEENKKSLDDYLSNRRVKRCERFSTKLMALTSRLYHEGVEASKELYRRAATQHWMF